MHYFYILKNHEKLEIFDELFDQLNSNTPIGINLFEAFALNDEIISYNQDEWVSRIKPLLVQNLVNQNYSNLVENIKRKIDFFSEYNKQTLNDILNPYS